MAGVSLTQRTPAEARPEVYSEQMTRQTYQTLMEQALAGVITHGGAVIDATFSTCHYRELLALECRKVRVCFQMIELQAPDEQIVERLNERDSGRAETSDARVEDIAKLNAVYEAPRGVAELFQVSSAASISATARDVVLQLAEKQAQHS
jgi:predicted kinase